MVHITTNHGQQTANICVSVTTVDHMPTPLSLYEGSLSECGQTGIGPKLQNPWVPAGETPTVATIAAG